MPIQTQYTSDKHKNKQMAKFVTVILVVTLVIVARR